MTDSERTPRTTAGRALVEDGAVGAQHTTYGSFLQAVLAIEAEKDTEYERVVDLYRRQRDEAALAAERASGGPRAVFDYLDREGVLTFADDGHRQRVIDGLDDAVPLDNR